MMRLFGSDNRESDTNPKITMIEKKLQSLEVEALTSKLRDGLSLYTSQIAALKEEHTILRDELDRLRAGNASCVSQAVCLQVRGINSENTSGPTPPGVAVQSNLQAQTGARCVDALRLCLAAGNYSRLQNVYSPHECHHGPSAPTAAQCDSKKGTEEHMCCLHRIAIPNKFVSTPPVDSGDLSKQSKAVEAEVGKLISPKLKTVNCYVRWSELQNGPAEYGVLDQLRRELLAHGAELAIWSWAEAGAKGASGAAPNANAQTKSGPSGEAEQSFTVAFCPKVSRLREDVEEVIYGFDNTNSENVVVLVLHTLPVSAASSVPSSATFLGVRADVDGILPSSFVKAKSAPSNSGTEEGTDEDEVNRLVKCGLLRAVVDLVLWDRSLASCPTNAERLAALARLFTKGLSEAVDEAVITGGSGACAKGDSHGEQRQMQPKQTSKSVSFGAKVKDL